MLGTVAALYRYPVKALRAEPLATAEVTTGGFAGDRAAALIVRSSGHARSGKTYRGKEQRLLHTVTAIAAAETLAHEAGLIVAAEREQPHYFDAEPVSIVFDRWLRELADDAGRAVDALQFRPNVVVSAAADFTAAERDLIGARLTIGSAEFAVVSPITRCVTIGYDVATGEPDPALLRTIVQRRGNQLGVYCRVLRTGTVSRGDAVSAAAS